MPGITELLSPARVAICPALLALHCDLWQPPASSLLIYGTGACSVSSTSQACHKALRHKMLERSKNIMAAKSLESIWIRKASEKHLESVPAPARCIHFQSDFVIWVAMNQQEENFYSTCALAGHCIIVCNTSRCWIILQIALLCTFVPLELVLSA